MPEVNVSVTLIHGPPWGFRLHGGPQTGLRVSRVRRRGPAETAGLREGDSVLAINRIPISGLSYAQAMELAEKGPQLQLELKRYKTFISEVQTQSETFVIGNVSKVPQNCVSSIVMEPRIPTLAEMQLQFPRQSFDLSLDDGIDSTEQDDSENLELRVIPADPEIRPIALEKLFREASPSTRSPSQSHTKKGFCDSAFYHDPNHYYPTVEEQKELANLVARTLFDTRNLGSKGSNMFERRRQRADKWTTKDEESDDEFEPEPETIESVPTMDEVEKLKAAPPAPPLSILSAAMGYVPPAPPVPPPKTVKEFMEKVKKTPKTDHRSVEPAKCFDIAAALHGNQDSKGAALFSKRRAKSHKWVLESKESPEEKILLSAPIMAVKPGPMNTDNVKNLIRARVGATQAINVTKPAVSTGEGLAEKIQRLQSASDAWEQSLNCATPIAISNSTPIHSRSNSALVDNVLTHRLSSAPVNFHEGTTAKPSGWKPMRYNRPSGSDSSYTPPTQAGGISSM